MRLKYTDRAKEDVEVALIWYERQRNGLGSQFVDCIEVAIRSILENPKAYRIRYENFRGCVVRRFPFTVFFTIEHEELIVQSVFDNRQNPGKRP